MYVINMGKVVIKARRTMYQKGHLLNPKIVSASSLVFLKKIFHQAFTLFAHIVSDPKEQIKRIGTPLLFCMHYICAKKNKRFHRSWEIWIFSLENKVSILQTYMYITGKIPFGINS